MSQDQPDPTVHTDPVIAAVCHICHPELKKELDGLKGTLVGIQAVPGRTILQFTDPHSGLSGIIENDTNEVQLYRVRLYKDKLLTTVVG